MVDIRFVDPDFGGDTVPHTRKQADQNNFNLKEAIETIEAALPGQPYQITLVTQVDDLFYLHLSDGETVLGPITIPRSIPATVVTVSAAAYTPALGEANSYFRGANAGGLAFTIPDESTVNYPVGTWFGFYQAAPLPVTLIEGATAVVFNLPTGKAAETAEQGAFILAKKVATDEWDVIGWLADASTGTAT
jgi:hypothetical protein